MTSGGPTSTCDHHDLRCDGCSHRNHRQDKRRLTHVVLTSDGSKFFNCVSLVCVQRAILHNAAIMELLNLEINPFIFRYGVSKL